MFCLKNMKELKTKTFLTSSPHKPGLEKVGLRVKLDFTPPSVPWLIDLPHQKLLSSILEIFDQMDAEIRYIPREQNKIAAQFVETVANIKIEDYGPLGPWGTVFEEKFKNKNNHPLS